MRKTAGLTDERLQRWVVREQGLCGEINATRTAICILDAGHDGKHGDGWDGQPFDGGEGVGSDG